VGLGYSARDCMMRRYADEKRSQGESHQGVMVGQFRDNGGIDPRSKITRASTRVPYLILMIIRASQDGVRVGHPGLSTSHTTQARARVPYPRWGRGQTGYSGSNNDQIT
jgi:hypothetical protein